MLNPVVLIAAILSTLNAEGPAPDGVIYAGVMDRVSLSTYQGLISGLISVGLIEKEWDRLYLTAMGKAKAKEIDELIN